jgi:enamine deaminase RidA (YjgF/YER057c/UK114 family)
MDKLHPTLRLSGLFAAAILIGMALRSLPSDSTSLVAQGKKAPSPEEQIRKLKLDLPAVAKPTNTYVPAVRVGDLLFISGTIPLQKDGKPLVGRVGRDLDVTKGQAAGRQVALQILSVVKAELGSLDKVARLVRTFGMVNAPSDFTEHPQVMNGFSDLMVEVFGDDAGKGTRCAVGVSSLPLGVPLEVEAIFEVRK